MSQRLSIAVFLSTFPVVSETFILRQITSLLDLGHEVNIYADHLEAEPAAAAAVQPEIASHALLERARAIRMPPDSGVWEMPIRPLSGQTWLPGERQARANWRRALQALPAICSAGVRAPRLLRQALSTSNYGFQAASLSSVYRLADLAKHCPKHDIAHAHFGPVGNSYRFIRRLWNKPFIVSFHGYDFSTVPKKSGAGVYTKLLAEADAVTVNSECMRQGLSALGCPSAKLHKIPYGIRLQDYEFNRQQRREQSVRILTVGRLVEKKGIEFSIRAFAKLRQKHPEAIYDIVGDGPLKGSLQKLCESLGTAQSVRFHGACDAIAVRKLLKESHLFVLASVTARDGDREGTPVSLLEAQASGLPVLSTEHSGIPEIVCANRSGFLVREGDVEELSRHMETLVDHPDLAASMGKEGAEFVRKNFSQEIATAALLGLYESLAGQKFNHNPQSKSR